MSEDEQNAESVPIESLPPVVREPSVTPAETPAPEAPPPASLETRAQKDSAGSEKAETLKDERPATTKTKPFTWSKIAYQLRVAIIVSVIGSVLDFFIEFLFPGAKDGIWSLNKNVVESIGNLAPLHLMTTFYGQFIHDFNTPGPNPSGPVSVLPTGFAVLLTAILDSFRAMFTQSFARGLISGLVDLLFLGFAAYFVFSDKEPGCNPFFKLLAVPFVASLLAAVIEIPLWIAGALLGQIIHGVQTAVLLGAGSIPVSGVLAAGKGFTEHHLVEGTLKKLEKAEGRSEKPPPE